jgi:hypothetical protein
MQLPSVAIAHQQLSMMPLYSGRPADDGEQRHVHPGRRFLVTCLTVFRTTAARQGTAARHVRQHTFSKVEAQILERGGGKPVRGTRSERRRTGRQMKERSGLQVR